MDYNPIFNKLTRDSFYKFVELYELETQIKKGTTKAEFQSNLLSLFSKDSIIEKKFQDFYLKTEEAGRKHIYIKTVKYSQDIINQIKKIAKQYPPEDKRSFDPNADDNKIFISDTGKSMVVKRIKISKIYNLFDKDEKNNMLTKIYNIKLIHFIEYIRFNFWNNTIYYGYDVYGDYLDRKSIEDSLNALLKLFLTDDMISSFSSFINSNKIEKLRLQPNCIASSLSNRIVFNDQAVFKKNKGNIDKILKDLKASRYSVSEIKEKNPTLDIQTHPLFEASFEHSIENNLDLKNNGVELYYFTNKSGITSCFRIKIDIPKDLVITFSDSITREELYDVFAKLN